MPVVKRKRQDLTKPTQTLITMYGKRKGEEGLEEEEERERKCRKFSGARNSGNGHTHKFEDQSSPRKEGGERELWRLKRKVIIQRRPLEQSPYLV